MKRSIFSNALSVLLLIAIPPIFVIQQTLISMRKYAGGIKNNDAILILTVTTFATLFYVGGNQYISGEGISVVAGFYYAALALTASLFLCSLRNTEFLKI